MRSKTKFRKEDFVVDSNADEFETYIKFQRYHEKYEQT